MGPPPNQMRAKAMATSASGNSGFRRANESPVQSDGEDGNH